MIGYLIIDKPVGMTSHDVVARVRKILKTKKVGHAGTLDPFATGVLPLAIGEATKTLQFIVAQHKSYRACIQWGAKTTTDDLMGDIIATSEHRPDQAMVTQALAGMTGQQMQVPPAYSAKKINGTRAYDLARQGQALELSPCAVELLSASVIAHDTAAGHTTIDLSCGKGFYVRALARDLGAKLGCFGHLMALRRTQVGHFYEKDAVTLDILEKSVHNTTPEAVLRPLEHVLVDIPGYDLDQQQAEKVRHGQAITVPDQQAETIALKYQDAIIGFAKYAHSQLQPVRILNIER